VFAGVSIGSACPLAGTGCQKESPSLGWITVASPRAESAVLMSYPLLSIFAHVSRSPTVRLNTSRDGDESRSSTQK